MLRWIRPIGQLALAATLLGSVPANAQSSWDIAESSSRLYAAVTYKMAVPLSATRDTADEFSPLGVGLDLRYMVRDNLSAGLAFGWQVFDEKTDEVLVRNNIAIQATQVRFVNAVPLLANVHYYLSGLPRGIRPFAGLNVGTYFFERRIDLGTFSFTDDTWHFGLAPELGVAWPVGDIFAVFTTRYNVAFSSGGSGTQSFLGFNFGVGWRD